MSLARAILIYEWRRFLPALLSVAFAGVLMLVQLGLLQGMFGTVTALIDRAGADLWITSPETASFEQARDIPTALAALVRLHPQVLHVETLMVHDADWRSDRHTRVAVSLVGLQPSATALACPQQMRAALCARLAEPMAVLVDRGDLDKLHTGVGQLGEVNGHRVRVIGTVDGLRSIGSAYIFASAQTARALSDGAPGLEDAGNYILLKLRAGADAQQVRDQLQSLLQGQRYRVWTAPEFSSTSQRYWLLESGVGAGFLFSSLLGLIIGVVITSQTLRAVILASLREYASFRAIGVPALRLAKVILEQSAWIGGVGALLTLLLAGMALLLAQAFYVPLTLDLPAITAAGVLSVAAALGSGLLALRELYRLEPADLLR